MGNGNMAESIYFDAEDDEQGASMMMQSAPLVDQLHGKRPSRCVLLVIAHMRSNPEPQPPNPNPKNRRYKVVVNMLSDFTLSLLDDGGAPLPRTADAEAHPSRPPPLSPRRLSVRFRDSCLQLGVTVVGEPGFENGIVLVHADEGSGTNTGTNSRGAGGPDSRGPPCESAHVTMKEFEVYQSEGPGTERIGIVKVLADHDAPAQFPVDLRLESWRQPQATPGASTQFIRVKCSLRRPQWHLDTECLRQWALVASTIELATDCDPSTVVAIEALCSVHAMEMRVPCESALAHPTNPGLTELRRDLCEGRGLPRWTRNQSPCSGSDEPFVHLLIEASKTTLSYRAGPNFETSRATSGLSAAPGVAEEGEGVALRISEVRMQFVMPLQTYGGGFYEHYLPLFQTGRSSAGEPGLVLEASQSAFEAKSKAVNGAVVATDLRVWEPEEGAEVPEDAPLPRVDQRSITWVVMLAVPRLSIDLCEREYRALVHTLRSLSDPNPADGPVEDTGTPVAAAEDEESPLPSSLDLTVRIDRANFLMSPNGTPSGGEEDAVEWPALNLTFLGFELHSAAQVNPRVNIRKKYLFAWLREPRKLDLAYLTFASLLPFLR